MNVSINLLPDDLRRRSIRTRVIRLWTPILLTLAATIAGVTYYEWTQCSIVSAAADQLGPGVQVAEQAMAAVAESEKQAEGLRKEIAEIHALRRSEDPVLLLNILSRSATDIGDQLTVSRLDLLGTEENAATSGSDTQTTLPAPSESSTALTLKTVLHINGLAVSDISVARFMNSLRSSGGFHQVTLKSSQPSVSSGLLQRAFVVECVREEPRG